MIMEYMNEDFDAFREAGTAGKDIDMPNGSDIFADWIIQAYKDKGADFFITNNYTILPIERFREYFEVTAKYRIKRSGSGNVGKSRLKPVMDYISTHDYVITDSRVAGDKLFVVSPQQLHDHRFILRRLSICFLYVQMNMSFVNSQTHTMLMLFFQSSIKHLHLVCQNQSLLLA